MPRQLKKALIITVAALSAVMIAALIVYWPLLVFLRGWGQPIFYRSQDLPSMRQSANIAIVGGTLVDGTGGAPVENAVILIHGDHIVAAGYPGNVEIPRDALRIPAEGKTVLPGLIDMHVHLNKGDDLHLFLAAGVTSVRDVGDFTDRIVPLERRTRSGEIIGPRIFFSGESFIHKSGFAAWQRPTKDAAEARSEVRKRLASGATVIKIVSDITPELVEAIVDEAHRTNVPVTADILGNHLVTAERAIRLGVNGLEHTSGIPQSIRRDRSPADTGEPVSFNAMFGWLYPDPQKENALIQLIVDRGTYIVPTFAVLEAESGVPVSTDPTRAYLSKRLTGLWSAMGRLPELGGGLGVGAFLVHFAYSQPFVGKVMAAGGRIVAGTDTPTPGVIPGFSMHRELELLVQAGLTPMQAIQAATKTAAQFLGKSNELGTLEPGHLAELILVDGAPHRNISDIRKIRTVIKGGMVFDASEVLRLSGKAQARAAR